MSKPFEGIKVLDFTQVLAGPFCAENMAYLGADVIKIEQRGQGDQTRAMLGDPAQQDLKLGPYFIAMNAGKRSMTLDLKHPRAKEVIYQLAEKADVLLQNFKAGTMERKAAAFKKKNDVLLELLGEKTEELEDLQSDMAELKKIYRAQLDAQHS